jgi:glucosamine-6-phosphate deaminase
MAGQSHQIDLLKIRLYPDRAALGAAAAAECAGALRHAIERSGRARIIFASAPSQDDFLAALVAHQSLPWERIVAFHLDEYVGIAATNPGSFRRYLGERLPIPPMTFHGLEAEADDLDAACRGYAELLAEAPVDICCLGIGENGHLAFNEPPDADFADPALVKQVELTPASRRQQVNDGCFPDLATVPTYAVTLTIPALLAARHLICVVPGPSKAVAVRKTLEERISCRCPASVLRTHASASLYLDRESAGLLAWEHDQTRLSGDTAPSGSRTGGDGAASGIA